MVDNRNISKIHFIQMRNCGGYIVKNSYLYSINSNLSNRTKLPQQIFYVCWGKLFFALYQKRDKNDLFMRNSLFSRVIQTQKAI